MTGMLDGGTLLTADDGESVRVIDMLGAGGQGRCTGWRPRPASAP